MNKELLKDIGEIIGGIITMLVIVLLAWLYLILTPPQMSGEYDLAVEAAEKSGIEIGGAK